MFFIFTIILSSYVYSFECGNYRGCIQTENGSIGVPVIDPDLIRTSPMLVLGTPSEYAVLKEKIGPMEDISFVKLMYDDVDNDGDLEIIATSGGDWAGSDGNGYVFVYDAITKELEWQSSNYNWIGGLEIADLNNDGTKEILIGYGKRIGFTGQGRVLVFNGITHSLIWQSADNGYGIFDIEVADIDSDGVKEIVASTGTGTLNVYNGETFALEWSKTGLDGSVQPIELDDVDDDGVMEIIVGTTHYVRIYNGITKALEWISDEMNYYTHDIRIGDIDNDNVKEIVTIRQNNRMFIFDGIDHTLEWEYEITWPQSLELFDVDSDGVTEILIGQGINVYSSIYALNAITKTIEWQSSPFNRSVLYFPLIAYDIDNDNIIELVAGTGPYSEDNIPGWLYIFAMRKKGEYVDLVINNITFSNGYMNFTLDNLGTAYAGNIEVKIIDTYNGNFVKEKTKVFSVGKSSTLWLVDKNHEIQFIIDPNKKIIESDISNNIASKLYKGLINLYIESDVPPTAANQEIVDYVKNNLQSYKLVSEEEADVSIFIARHNPLIVWHFFTLEDKGWGYNGNYVEKDDVVEDKPYGGLVGSFDKDNKHFVMIHGNDVDGFIAASKEFTSNQARYLNSEDATLLDKNNIQALAVYDYLHSPANIQHYKKNTYDFSLIVKNALNDQMIEVTNMNITINNSDYRLKKIKSSGSDLMREYLDPDGYPVVMGRGLWSNLDDWSEFGSEIANEGKDVYLIELTGGPYTERDNDYDYPYKFLTDHVFPSYVSEILTMSNKDKIKYVGHSNAARVALDSLTESQVDPAVVDTLILAGVPGNFSELSFFAKLVSDSGDVAIARMRGKNLTHVTFSRVAHELDSGIGEFIAFRSSFVDKDNKLSLNLFQKYHEFIISDNDKQPGIGLNIDYIGLIYGTKGWLGSETDDLIVPVSDEISIFNGFNTPISNKILISKKVSHTKMSDDKNVQDEIKDILNK
ncbi:MAG: FG-GAP-like repeat-containing protein [Nanoarchaeota archaeon]